MFEDDEGLEETLELLEDAETLEALRESDDDVREGRLFTLDEIRDG